MAPQSKRAEKLSKKTNYLTLHYEGQFPLTTKKIAFTLFCCYKSSTTICRTLGDLSIDF
jgi:hypothetical protein